MIGRSLIPEMGFPVGCSELVLPRFLVWLIFLLGALRRAILWCLAAVGLGDLLDADAVVLAGGGGSGGSSGGTGSGSFFPVTASNSFHPHGPRPLSASLVLGKIPVVRFERRPEEEGDEDGDLESCAVCLYEIEGGEEVRRLGLCRHVFHRCCIDPWVQIGRRTCPLCRAPIADEDGGVGEGDAADTVASFGSYYPYDSYHDLMGAYYGGEDEGDYAGLFPPLLDDEDVDRTVPRSFEFMSWPLPGVASAVPFS